VKLSLLEYVKVTKFLCSPLPVLKIRPQHAKNILATANQYVGIFVQFRHLDLVLVLLFVSKSSALSLFLITKVLYLTLHYQFITAYNHALLLSQRF